MDKRISRDYVYDIDVNNLIKIKIPSSPRIWVNKYKYTVIISWDLTMFDVYFNLSDAQEIELKLDQSVIVDIIKQIVEILMNQDRCIIYLIDSVHYRLKENKINIDICKGKIDKKDLNAIFNI